MIFTKKLLRRTRRLHAASLIEQPSAQPYLPIQQALAGSKLVPPEDLIVKSAEDEVLVAAAVKGDKDALEKQAPRETGHHVWLHCIILMLNALPSPRSPSFRAELEPPLLESGYRLTTWLWRTECLRLLKLRFKSSANTKMAIHRLQRARNISQSFFLWRASD